MNVCLITRKRKCLKIVCWLFIIILRPWYICTSGRVWLVFPRKHYLSIFLRMCLNLQRKYTKTSSKYCDGHNKYKINHILARNSNIIQIIRNEVYLNSKYYFNFESPCWYKIYIWKLFLINFLVCWSRLVCESLMQNSQFSNISKQLSQSIIAVSHTICYHI